MRLLVLATLIAMLSLAASAPAKKPSPAHTTHHVPKSFADIEEAARLFHIDRPVDTTPPSARKTVILLTVSYGYIDFFRNWLYYFRKLAIGNYIVIAEDQITFDELFNNKDLQMKGRVLLADDGNSVMNQLGSIGNATNALKYLTPEYIALMERRPYYIQTILALSDRYDVLFTDADIIWLDDPLKYFTNESVSVFALADVRNHTMSTVGQACGGFWLLRNTDLTQAFITDWVDAMIEISKSGKKSGNQPSFNRLLTKYTSEHRDFILSMLPLSEFASGELYFNEKGWREKHPTPAVIHNNFASTSEVKIARFKKYDMWHPNEL